MHPIEISRPIHHAGWVYEEKVDGRRMVATKADGAVRLVSRNGLDHTKRFRELVKALAALKPAAFTLDGEVAVYDQAFICASSGCGNGPRMSLPPCRSTWCLTCWSWVGGTCGERH